MSLERLKKNVRKKDRCGSNNTVKRKKRGEKGKTLNAQENYPV